MSDLRSDEVTFPALNLHGFIAVYPNTQWERPVWFWPPPAPSCVCVLVCSALVCSTCVWHYCDKAAQPLRGDGECQRLERRSEQLLNIRWNEKHTRWMAGLLTPQRGSRAEGWGQVKPQMCVWNITPSLFCLFTSLHLHISPLIPKNNKYTKTHTHTWHLFTAG